MTDFVNMDSGSMVSAGGPDIRAAVHINLTAEVETVLRTMFGEFDQVVADAEFGRGFSGGRAFRVRLVDKEGRAHLPTVVKIARRGLIEQEWQAYKKWVRPTLHNAPRLDESPTLSPDGSWGGLCYALVGGGTFEVQSLHEYYHQADVEDLCWVLENRLFKIMGPNWWLDNRADRAFQMQADYDDWLPVNLVISPAPSPLKAGFHLVEPGPNLHRTSIAIGDQVRLKGFVVTKVVPEKREVTLNVPQALESPRRASYRVRLVDAPDIDNYQVGEPIDPVDGSVGATRHDVLAGLASHAMWRAADLSHERLTLSGDLTLPNPLLTYQGLLHAFLTVNTSTIHGDLNLENVLVDPATREVFLIDFATVRRGHTLHDLLRLEAEVVIMLIPPILEAAGLPPESIYYFYEQLHRVTLSPGQVTSLNLPASSLEKPFRMLLSIRGMARKCLFNPDDWREYYQGLILYLLGILKFETLHGTLATPLPRQVAFWSAATAQHILDTSQRQSGEYLVNRGGTRLFDLESPYGTVRPDSRFYVERAADEICWQHIGGTYAATLFVQAPMRMGKSSLVRRALDRARKVGHKGSAFIDFQKFATHCLEDEENFLIELCLMIGDELGVEEAIDRYWTGRRSNLIKCSRYMSGHVIPAVKGSFILAMDEMERMLDCPFRADFFGMLRTWHNNRIVDDDFARMSLFLSSSTDPLLLIDNPNQSPFNVATPVPLEDFSLDQVRELNKRHNSPLGQTQVDELMHLLNGHPFLTRLALYQLALNKIDMPALLAQATDDSGPFGEHLRHFLRRILKQPELKQALIDICREHTYQENDIFQRLRSNGLVKREGRQVVFRYNLYQRYFEERLNG